MPRLWAAGARQSRLQGQHSASGRLHFHRPAQGRQVQAYIVVGHRLVINQSQ